MLSEIFKPWWFIILNFLEGDRQISFQYILYLNLIMETVQARKHPMDVWDLKYDVALLCSASDGMTIGINRWQG